MEEVHRWRGSPDERATPSRDLGRFTYFDQQLGHPDWRGKRVLDFGGNDGNLLLAPNCPIAEEDYTCIDVLAGAVEAGRRRFPRAAWIHYDRYNCSFNPGGVEGLPVPPTGPAFDFIFAYSVFTHTTREDMHDLVGQLRARLAPGGALAFTFIDPQWRSWPDTFDGGNLEWRLSRFRESDPSLDVKGLAAQAVGAPWCSLIDGREIFRESNGVWDGQPCLSYHVYYAVEFLQREFPGAVIRPPVNRETQHCCILRSP
ncbi:MAG TPA: class I SAM-dependent methyltransferase [Thermoanaerobaculia bacterium]|nr:class I SAM-dependent methyltransferase [Thermoanaerobaculia bacterium]